MDESKTCETCEWWDDRLRGDDPSAADQMPCLRWVQYDLWKSAEERCWQWTGRGMNQFKSSESFGHRILDAENPGEREDLLQHTGRRLQEARRLLQTAVVTVEGNEPWTEAAQIWLQGE